MSKRLASSSALLVMLSVIVAETRADAADQPLSATPDDTTLTFESGPERIELLELYTSEGCNSCPPADRWFSKLKADKRLWKDFAPVAFHVDYWDYIGWKDRFAQPEFAARQRQYAAEGGSRFVYTPGVFRNGEDWNQWRRGKFRAATQAQPGNLAIAVDGDDVAAHFDPGDEHSGGLVVTAALLGMNLVSSVDAGENAGKILRHDFVVLDLESVRLKETVAGYSAKLRLATANTSPFGTAIVAWVSDDDTLAPVQVVGGYLVPPP